MLTVDEAAETLNASPQAFRRRVSMGLEAGPTTVSIDGEGLWSKKDLNGFSHEKFLAGPPTSSRDEWFELLHAELRHYLWRTGKLSTTTETPGRVRRYTSPHGPAKTWTYPLGLNVQQLRTAKKMGTVPDEWVRKFNRIPGWTWEQSEDPWFDRLRRMHKRYPDHLISRDTSWLAAQHVRTDLSAAQRRALRKYPVPETAVSWVAIDFVECAFLWMQRMDTDDLSTMKIRHAYTPAAVHNLDGSLTEVLEYPIGIRSNYLRRRYHGLEGDRPLAQVDVDWIDENLAPYGWTWDLRSPAGTRKPAPARRRAKGAAKTRN